MTESERIKMLIKVTHSPFKEDENLPWEWEHNAFCDWVWNVFLDGYKRSDVECPDLETAIGYLRNMGFVIEKIKPKPFDVRKNQQLCNQSKLHDESQCDRYH